MAAGPVRQPAQGGTAVKLMTWLSNRTRRSRPRVPEASRVIRNAASGDIDAKRRVAEMGSEAIPFLRDALEHGEPELRRWSVATLAELSQHVGEAVPVLSLALDDADAEVRDEALHGFLAAASRSDLVDWGDHAR